MVFLLVSTLAYGFEQIEFKMKLGQEGAAPGQLKEPSDIAVDSDGIIYVADKGNKRINIMDRDGRTINTWRSSRTDGWKLDEPAGIAVYGNKVYVTDSYNDQVLVFFKSGVFVDKFGGSGSGPKQFDEPHGICVRQGIVYVADTGNNRVQLFSLDGIYLGSIGKKGDGLGEMSRPTDVAVDGRGYIYVSEEGNDRIGVFLQSGRLYRYYYDVKGPTSVAVDRMGFFVGDAGNFKIKKFNLESRLILSFGTEGKDDAQFRSISGVAVDKDGNIYVVDSGRNDIQIFVPERKIRMAPDSVPPPDSVKWLNDVKAKVADIAWYKDRLYATSPEGDELVLIQDGAVRQIIKGEGKNRLSEPYGIAVDDRGYLWIADSGNDRVVRTDREGKVVFSLGESGGEEVSFSSPSGIAVSSKGFIYVADTGNERLLVFNDKGVFITKIEKAGRDDFDEPVDVVLDNSGNIYVADKGLNEVAKYSSSGRFLMYIGGEGKSDGRFEGPTSLAVLDNELFVLDSGNSRIQIFDLRGKFLRKFGSEGKGRGEFMNPLSMAAKDDTTLFVSDSENSRIEEFKILRTPGVSLRLEAKTGVKDVRLRWLGSRESYVSHYRVYRSDHNVVYRLIASPPTPEYTDNNVEPGKTYYYKVSAVAEYGNEGARSVVVVAKTKKIIALPPAGLTATPDERAILLRWKPAGGESFASYYVIYRDVNGVYKDIGRVKDTSFKDEGLKPQTDYTYKVAAVSPNNEESKGVILKTATILRRPPLEIEVLQIRDIFPRAFRIYEKDGIGQIRVSNNSNKQVNDIKISFKTREFMDRPALIKIKSLQPSKSVEVNIKPVVFNNRILLLKEDRSVKADIGINYVYEGSPKSYSTTHDLMIILTGRKYTKTQVKRFLKAVSSLERRVIKAKAYKRARGKIMKELDTRYSVIKRLRDEKLGYGEVVSCIYISNETGRPPMDILNAEKAGQKWQDLMSMFDLDINDVTNTIEGISRSIILKKKSKPRRRRMETDRYIK